MTYEQLVDFVKNRTRMSHIYQNAVVAMRDEGKISAEVMSCVERDIDLEELRSGG